MSNSWHFSQLHHSSEGAFWSIRSARTDSVCTLDPIEVKDVCQAVMLSLHRILSVYLS